MIAKVGSPEYFAGAWEDYGRRYLILAGAWPRGATEKSYYVISSVRGRSNWNYGMLPYGLPPPPRESVKFIPPQRRELADQMTRRAAYRQPQPRLKTSEERRDDAWMAEVRESLRPVKRRRRKAKPWAEKTRRGPRVFIEDIGWLNERESAAFNDDEAVINDFNLRNGAWCDTEWDARFRAEEIGLVAAPFDGTGVSLVIGRTGREILPKRIPWVDDEGGLAWERSTREKQTGLRGSDW